MTFTREQLIEKVKNKDIEFFHDIYNGNYGDRGEKCDNKCKTVWDLNWGDGNDWSIAINFPDENLNVMLEGYYSSHGDSEFDKVSLAMPYEHKETRYREMKIEDIRDQAIDEVIK